MGFYMLATLLVVAQLAASVNGQSTAPLFDVSVCGTPVPGRPFETVNFIADATSSCWYWRCISFRGMFILGRRAQNCALGTAVSSFYGAGAQNPCTERFDPANKFDCTRKEFNLDPNARPQCVLDYERDGTCKNGGVIEFGGNLCSCNCEGTGFADWDCSKRPQDLIGAPNVHPNSDDPCPNGIPLRDFCGLGTVNGAGPCQNNGRCINQCTNYVCECIPPFTAGRNCETFDCTNNVECLNGGTCSRGASGNNQFATCACLPGFSGLMCEVIEG